MTSHMKFGCFRLSCIAGLLAGMFAPAYGQQLNEERRESINQLAAVSSEVKVGIGIVADDNRRFGQYSGMVDEGGAVVLGVNYQALDKASGTWLKLYGRNLGLDIRELSLDHYRQGVWRCSAGFSQTARYEPMEVVTGLSGIGTKLQTVNGVGLRPVDLAMKRELLSLGGDYALGDGNAVRLRYTHEDKDGARLFGRGQFGTPAAIEFLAEPISRNTQTLELTFGHAGVDFQVSGGYYGTLFINYSDHLKVVGDNTTNVLNTGATPWTPMSMPLSNESHQLFLTGAYSLLPQTRLSFKASSTVARQNEDFMAVSPAPKLSGAQTLEGRVVTTLGYIDVTSMEFADIDLQANIRFEDRNDKTPERQYLTLSNPGATVAGVTGFNKPRDWRSLAYKVEAGYRLPANYRLLAGWVSERQERNISEDFRRVGFRGETTEETARLELKQTVSESMNIGIGYSQSNRFGSPYVPDTYLPTSSSDINTLLWADRERHTWRLSLDMIPLDDLSLRLSYDRSDDVYGERLLGPEAGGRSYYALDASYSLSSRWQFTLFASRDDTMAKQSTHTGVGPSQQWAADLRQIGDAFGLGLQGKMRNGLNVGGDLNYYRESAQNRMRAISSNFAVTSLPDYTYRLTEMKLFANYALDANASVQADYLFHNWRTDDWTWNGWTYSDGTTLRQNPEQKTHYIGASYLYRWK